MVRGGGGGGARKRGCTVFCEKSSQFQAQVPAQGRGCMRGGGVQGGGLWVGGGG